MPPLRRLMLACLLSIFGGCAAQVPPDTDPIRPDQDPWERVGSSLARKQAATR